MKMAEEYFNVIAFETNKRNLKALPIIHGSAAEIKNQIYVVPRFCKN
jgi:hypothetical protein